MGSGMSYLQMGLRATFRYLSDRHLEVATHRCADQHFPRRCRPAGVKLGVLAQAATPSTLVS
jgi:hypothetical protein